MAPRVQLPALQEPFPASFQALLPALIATRSHVDAARVERLRLELSTYRHEPGLCRLRLELRVYCLFNARIYRLFHVGHDDI